MFHKLAAICVATCVAGSVQAGMIQSIVFEGSGAVTNHYLDLYCDDDQTECWNLTPDAMGYPPIGTPFTLTGTIQFAQPVPDTGIYYYNGWDEETAFTGTLSLTIIGYPGTGWGLDWYADGWEEPYVLLEGGKPVGFYNYFEGCAGMEGLSAGNGNLSYDWRDCWWGGYDTYFTLEAKGQIDRVWVDGRLLGVPEPAAWAMLITGFGLVGTALRQRRGQHRLAA